MSSCPSKCSESSSSGSCPERLITDLARKVGACACAVIRAGEVDEESREVYKRWIEAGDHGTMQYCEKYMDVRDDPRLLLPGCKWLIICAFSYSDGMPVESKLRIARYALGSDYHHVLPLKMQTISDFLTENYGGETLTAVDTKPLRERYWAQKAGLGRIGKNNQLIIPGIGSYVFLATMLWTGEIIPESADPQGYTGFAPMCNECDACVRACPNGALRGDGSCDARMCISYLTIEHKGELAPEMDLRGRGYGCDICQVVCPYNSHPPADSTTKTNILPELRPRPEIVALDEAALRAHTGRSWKRFLDSSPMQRVPLSRLLSHFR